ncbi:UbiA prenyltransferase family-domain-containing protein [Aspergillus egyptiacus]|nr:UbiA prenyltransferase family-domain-containing protein [Aspergillus egyptiacus]
MVAKNPPVHPACSMLSWLHQELVIYSRLVSSNAYANFGSFTICTIARYLAAPVPYTTLIHALVDANIAAFIWSYIFDIANQTTSVLEDQINKPSRPIPAGLLSTPQAQTRWLLSWIIGPIVMFAWYGPWAALHMLVWELWVWFSYVWPKYNNWAIHSIFTSVGMVMLMRVANAVMRTSAPHWDISAWWDLPMLPWSMLTVHLQEFHDMEGDRMSGRKTLPLVLTERGIQWLRVVTAAILIAGAVFSVGWVGTQTPSLWGAWASSIVHSIIATLLAVRTVWTRSTEMDWLNYHLFYIAAAHALFVYLSQLAYAV